MSRFKALVLVPLIGSLLMPLWVRAASPSLVISQIQTASATNAGQEFVELYNPTAADVAVDGWQLQYKSATSAVAESSWTKRAGLAGKIAAHGFYLISQKTYLPAADADLSAAGMASSGGHVRLKDGSGVVVDLVGWGATANAAETAPAAAPAAGQSIERLPGRLTSGFGNSTDTNDNSKDFVLDAAPHPRSSASPIEDPAVAAIADTEPAVTTPIPTEDQVTPVPVVYAPLYITELLPDPAAPLTDASDEFIELYNPTSDPVDLAGYTVRTGSNFHAFYTLPAQTLAPLAYLAIYSKDSHINIPNAGGAAQILDPTGKVTYQTDTYPKAVTGQSWSLIDGVWEWSLQSTPGAENIYVAPLATPAVSPVTLPKSTKSTAATTVKTTTVKPPKSTSKAASAPKTPKAKTTSQTALVSTAATQHSGSWLLIGLAIVSIGYAIYEFRHDVRNHYHLARKYLKARRANRPAA